MTKKRKADLERDAEKIESDRKSFARLPAISACVFTIFLSPIFSIIRSSTESEERKKKAMDILDSRFIA